MSRLITSMLKRLSAQNLKQAGEVFLESLHNEFGDGPVRLEAVGLIGTAAK